MLKLIKKYIILFYFVVISFSNYSLYSQMYCQGDGCSYLPIDSTDLNKIFTALQTNYLNEVLKDMATANAYSLTNTIPSSVVNLDEFTLGASIVFAQTKQRKIDVFVPDYGTLEDMPSIGVSLIPSVFVGMNLGYMLSDEPTPIKIPWYSIHRLDLYITYLNSGVNNEQFNTGKKKESWQVLSKSIGLDIRYHLAEGDKETSYFFGFSGVSLGVGYHKINQNLKYIQKDSKIILDASNKADLTWKADNQVELTGKMELYSLDIRTGIQLLYLFRFSIGAGHSWLKGNTDLKFQRFGPITVTSDILTILGYKVPDANLGILLQGSGSPKQKNITYLTTGLELNFPVFKVYLEAKGNQEFYSTSLGVRMSL